MPLKLATKFEPEPTAVANAQMAGFRFAELWLDKTVLANLRTVVDCLRVHSLEYALHFPNQLNLERHTLEETVALYRHLGCRSMVIHQPMYDKFSEILLALDHEPRLAVENGRLTPDQFEAW